MVRHSVRNDLIAQAAIVADNSTAALAFADAAAAAETLQALRAKPSIDLARVYDRTGAIFAQSQRPENTAVCPAAPPADLVEIRRSTRCGSRAPDAAARRIGTLFLVGNLDEVWQRMAIQARVRTAFARIVGRLFHRPPAAGRHRPAGGDAGADRRRYLVAG